MSWQPIWLSLQVASLATLLAGLCGVASAALLSRTRLPGRELVDVLVTAPMVLPPTVLGYYLLILLGRDSTIGVNFETITGTSIAFSRVGAVIAASFAALPFVLKAARVALEQVDPQVLAAARTLGAGSLRTFFRIELPLARSGIAAGMALGFARGLGEFGVTLMLAGNLPGTTQTGSLAIYDAVQANRDQDAWHLVIVMTAVAVAILYIVNRLSRRSRHAF